MIDADLRALERKLAENPGDPAASLALDRARARAGVLYTLPPRDRLLAAARAVSLTEYCPECGARPTNEPPPGIHAGCYRCGRSWIAAANARRNRVAHDQRQRERGTHQRLTLAESHLSLLWQRPGPMHESVPVWLQGVRDALYLYVWAGTSYPISQRTLPVFAGAELVRFRRHCLRIARGETRLPHADDEGWIPDD